MTTNYTPCIQHSKVVLGEPASLGTLLELGNVSLDILRLLVDRPATQALTPATGADRALDVRDTVAATRRNLEAALLYAVTQLALWLSKPELDGAPAADADADDMMVVGGGDHQHLGESMSMSASASVSARERRARKTSVTMAERLRRGMRGEMAADLQALLGKARLVVAKSAGVLGAGDVDLTQVLAYFVQERIAVPA